MDEEYPCRHPDFAPTHPGEVLREEVLPALKMPVATAARHLGVSRQAFQRVLSEQAGVTPALALRLGKFCGNGPGLWLRMQQAHDLWQAAKSVDVSDIPTFDAA